MPLEMSTRIFAAAATEHIDGVVIVRGWIHRLRVLPNTAFVVVHDCTGTIQLVCGTASFPGPHIKLDDTVELRGRVRGDSRAKCGCEIDIGSTPIAASVLLPGCWTSMTTLRKLRGVNCSPMHG